MVDEIKECILSKVPDAEVHIMDPHNDGQHFEGIVISESFNGIPLVKQHQLVMNALKEKFETSVHALALKTFTPEKWAQQKSNYNL